MKKSLVIITMLGMLAAMTSCGNDAAPSAFEAPATEESQTASASTTGASEKKSVKNQLTVIK